MNNDTQAQREALVIKSTGSWYTLCDSLSGERVEARLSGRIRLQGRRSTNPIVVGDRVDYRPESGGSIPPPKPEQRTGKAARKKDKGRAAAAAAGQPIIARTTDHPYETPQRSDGLASGHAHAVAQPGEGQPGEGQPGEGQPGEGQPGDAQFSGHLHATPQPGNGQACERTADGQAGRPEEEIPGGRTPTATGVITRIHDRHNYIIRRSSNLSHESHIIAANIDQAFLVVTLAFPETSFEFIDRFLVTAEAYHIPAVIVLNKTDLYGTPELQEKRAVLLDTYALAGYEVMELAAMKGEGVEALRQRLQGRVSLLSGNSGVGKSTLIRGVDPSLTPRVGAISDYHHRGRHTTTFSEMYPLEGGGWLIDTPGIKGFGLIDLSGGEVGRYFPDLFGYAPRCGYYNCTHTHEPGCAVKEAVEGGEVSLSRYISYLKLLEEDGKYRK